jgi:hypothetical protein
MGFYKNALYITLFHLLILLAVMALLLHYGNKKVIFPAQMSDCPDYYTLDSGNKCIANTSIYKPANGCDSVDFTKTEYKVPGMGERSGICKKKNWAIGCGVSWDGITNNGDICYTK